MHVIERPAGRLVTFRFTLPLSEDSGSAAAAELRACLTSVIGPAIIVTDLTAARAFPAETTERFVGQMKFDNAKIERSALLLGADSSTLLLQLGRMAKEALHASRRLFVDPRELSDWLAPSLTADERAALAHFLENPPQT